MSERSVFLLVEDNENDVILVQRAFSKANVLNPLAVVRNAEEAMAYFMGIGAYKDRSEYPLPSLVGHCKQWRMGICSLLLAPRQERADEITLDTG